MILKCADRQAGALTKGFSLLFVSMCVLSPALTSSKYCLHLQLHGFGNQSF